MKNLLIAGLGVSLIGALSGCQEPHNIRMRFAALVPGTPEQLVGIDAKQRILLCDPQTQEVLRVLGENRAPVRDLRVSADGSHIATVGTDQRCRVWSTTATAAPLTIAVPGAGQESGAVTFLDDGAHLAVGGAAAIDIIALHNGALVRRIPDAQQELLYAESEFQTMAKELAKARIFSLDAQPGANHLLLGTDCGAIEIDYVLCTVVWRQRERVGQAANLVRYLPDGERFVVQDDTGRLTLYANHKSVWSVRPGEGRSGNRRDAGVTAGEFTTDSAYLVALGADGRFRVLRLSDQQCIAELSPGKLDAAGVALSPQAQCAWVGSQGNVERFTRLALPPELTAPKTTIE